MLWEGTAHSRTTVYTFPRAVISPILWVSSVSSHFARFSVGEWW